ncbi:hypothetical protein RJT34_24888 [Clitoria ternatea]|uniref:Uncharacterized protein n=1 Tax=Clitoria ternatea TaxID=43366 RepID=A0AAN9FP11_CLITE
MICISLWRDGTLNFIESLSNHCAFIPTTITYCASTCGGGGAVVLFLVVVVVVVVVVAVAAVFWQIEYRWQRLFALNSIGEMSCFLTYLMDNCFCLPDVQFRCASVDPSHCISVSLPQSSFCDISVSLMLLAEKSKGPPAREKGGKPKEIRCAIMFRVLFSYAQSFRNLLYFALNELADAVYAVSMPNDAVLFDLCLEK